MWRGAIPITLQVSKSDADTYAVGEEVALAGSDGDILAVMSIADKYQPDQKLEAEKVYSTAEQHSPRRPGHDGGG